MTIFYFTGTGNSLAVAKRIGGDDARLISIPQVIDSTEQHYRDDAIGLVFPVYSFRAPMMVRNFLNRVKLEANYIFAICTYGTMSGSCTNYLQKQAIGLGFKFDYTNNLKMADNYLPLFETGKQIEKLSKKNIEQNLIRIIEDIKNYKKYHVRAAIFGRIVGKLVNMDFSKSPHKYIADEKCNKCGICAKVCLSKNITIDNDIKFGESCEGCYACLHLCPQNALHHKSEKSNKRWIHPDITLNEIIEANNRQN